MQGFLGGGGGGERKKKREGSAPPPDCKLIESKAIIRIPDVNLNTA